MDMLRFSVKIDLLGPRAAVGRGADLPYLRNWALGNSSALRRWNLPSKSARSSASHTLTSRRWPAGDLVRFAGNASGEPSISRRTVDLSGAARFGYARRATDDHH